MKRLVSRSAAAVVAAGMLGVLAVAPGCLDRPVAPQQPSTTKISTQLYRASKIDKIDLLFMIDNSASMADKQQILAAAVPDLVNRLVNPRCVDANGVESDADTAGKCASGSKREFEPVKDIHIGIISSSLGGHGADTCSPGPSGNYNVRQEDMAHLIQRKCADEQCSSFVAATDTYQNKGFLFWDPLQKGPKKDGQNPGDSNVKELTDKFTELVKGTGQDGCGFEAILEAWYRFLVDPAPFGKIVPTDCGTGLPDPAGGCRGPDGSVDDAVLQQRRDFLRPDSLLAVVMLADENDCSVMEGGQNYLATMAYNGSAPFHLPRGTSACIDNPNSPQCTSCGMPGNDGDSECLKGGFSETENEDALNLRCYRQKQRFGLDFLYPIRRYAYGLTQQTFKPEQLPGEWDGAAYPAGVTNGDFNPVFCTEYEKDANGVENRKLCKTVLRDPKLVFLAGIVGVPWQDIARDPNDLTKGYRPAEELSWTKPVYDSFNKGKDPKDQKTPAPGVTDKVSVWTQIVGETGHQPDPTKSRLDARTIPADRSADGKEHINPLFLQPDSTPSGMALDPLMVESIEPRSGTNPATGAALAPESAGEPMANPVNGHEWTVVARNDLQYACIFDLPAPKQCLSSESCDCVKADTDGTNNPLCQSGTGYGTTQYRAKAYPGRRQLATLRGVEMLSSGQAIAASICPAETKNTGASNYGYRPAIATIVERLRAVLAGTCWGQALEPAADGSVECIVLEATKYPEGQTTCPPCDPAKARSDANPETVESLKQETNFKENNLKCVCAIDQAKAAEPSTAADPLHQCMSSTEDYPKSGGAQVNGWCYVDPSTNKEANATLVATCAADAKRMIRFVGEANPVGGSLTYLQCKGATFGAN